MAARRDCVSSVFTTATRVTPFPRVMLRDSRGSRSSFAFSSRRTTLVHWLDVFGAASYDDPLLEFYGSTDDVCTVRSPTSRMGSKSIALRNEIPSSRRREMRRTNNYPRELTRTICKLDLTIISLYLFVDYNHNCDTNGKLVRVLLKV